MFRTLFLCTLLAAFAVGCQGPTYVNIPGQEGDTAFNDPNGDTARAVMAEGVRGLLAEKALDAPVAVELPEGATPLTHADVARRVGEPAISPYEDVEPGSTIEVREVRIRGRRAEVDIVAPDRGGVEQLTTVSMTWAPFGNWKAEQLRTWRAGAERLTPNYLDAPIEAP